jgi:hypothetical protein
MDPTKRFTSVMAFATALQTAGGTTEITEPFSTYLPQVSPTNMPPISAQMMPVAPADGTTQPAQLQPQADAEAAWHNQSPQGVGGQQLERPSSSREAASHQKHHEDTGASSRFRWVGGCGGTSWT